MSVSVPDDEDSLTNGKDRNGNMDGADGDRDRDKDESVIEEPPTASHSRNKSVPDDESSRREADREKADADRRKADMAEAERRSCSLRFVIRLTRCSRCWIQTPFGLEGLFHGFGVSEGKVADLLGDNGTFMGGFQLGHQFGFELA